MHQRQLLRALVVANVLLLLLQIIWVWRNWVNINLLLACASNDWVLPWLMLGADPNARTRNGTTALMLATSSGSFVDVLDLIRAGADVNCGDNSGRTPLHIATRNGDIALMRILLEHGADPNRKGGGFEYTPLMIAVTRENSRAVELLLASGADPTMTDTRGFTPLQLAKHFARRSRSWEAKKIVEMLEEHLRKRSPAK